MPVYAFNALDVALLMLRVAVGVKFLLHGVPKLKKFPAIVEMVKGVPFFRLAPKPFAAALVATEVLGGILLILGFFTPIVAALQAFVMLVAAMMNVRWKNWMEFGVNVVLYANSVAFVLLGAGAYSLDALLY
ncbi:MAG: DoxX family protein [Patescibacteria group bacterium]